MGLIERLARAILVKNLETLVCVSPSPMLIWVLQSRSQSAPKDAWLNIGEGEGHKRTKVQRVNVRNFRENSTQTVSVSTICDDDGDGKEERQKRQWIY